MNDASELIRRFVEDRDQLSGEELEMLVAVLRERSDLAVELKDQLIIDELLAQKLDLTRWHFLSQVEQRVQDESQGFPGIQASDLVVRNGLAPGGRGVTAQSNHRAAAVLKGTARRAGRRFAGGLALVLVLAAALTATGAWLALRHTGIAVVETTAGHVEMLRDEQACPARPGEAIRPGDRFVTAANSSVLVRYRDGTAIKIEADTSAAFRGPGASAHGKQVFVSQGSLSADVAPQPAGRPMIFESASASVEVLGTSLKFAVASHETRVTVIEGQVRVARAGDSEAVVVSKDQFAVVSPESVASAPVGWPSNRSGLIFLYQTNDQPNLVRSMSTGMDRSFSLRPRGRTHLNHDYAMVLTGGAFLAEDVDGEILAACRQTSQLTVEATVRPALAEQAGPARIVTFSTNVVDRDFTLGQLGDQLIVRIRTPQTGPNGVGGVERGLPVCRLAADEVNHVIVSYRPGKLVCYLNGAPVFESGQIEGDFSGWTAQHLLFGDEYGGDRNWTGTLEGIAIYNRFVEPDEARRNALQYEHLRHSRPIVPQVRVRARLIAKSAIPTARQIQPHRSALVVCKYEVAEVLEGRLEQTRLLVAQWALFDGQEEPIATVQVGTEAVLLLEPLDQNPQAQRYLYGDDFPLEEDGDRYLVVGQ